MPEFGHFKTGSFIISDQYHCCNLGQVYCWLKHIHKHNTTLDCLILVVVFQNMLSHSGGMIDYVRKAAVKIRLLSELEPLSSVSPHLCYSNLF